MTSTEKIVARCGETPRAFGLLTFVQSVTIILANLARAAAAIASIERPGLVIRE
jgi:hypothetical protein